jgi:geranylgeranyl diphosphate synthase type I
MDYMKLSSAQLTKEKIIESINWVTSTYTIKFPMYFGYLLAGKEIPKGLDTFVLDLGVLFQTGDDLIGIFGDPEVTQKSNYGDIVQGKKTMPMWFTYTSANEESKKKLDMLVGKEDLTKDEAEEVRRIVKESGGLEKTKEYMRALKDSCVSQVEQMDIPEDMKRFLKGFAIFLEKREM